MTQKPLNIRSLELSTGQSFSFLGPPPEEGPMPAFFYFALSGSDSLKEEPYNQPAVFLTKEKLRIFSTSLPYHDMFNKKEVMKKWAEEIESQRDFLTPFLDKTEASIVELIERKLIDPEALTAGGLSRGGLIALHMAARESRIHSVVLFAPLIKIKGSTTFEHLRESPLIKKLSAFDLIPKLRQTRIRLYIGNRDVMVGTTNAYEFIRKLTDEAFDAGQKSPKAELFISPSIGYKGHGTPPHIFEDGAKWIKKQIRT